jgi:glycosyltransferase involved in cell wall biosynthesis
MDEVLQRATMPFSVLLQGLVVGALPENWPVVGPLGRPLLGRRNTLARWAYRRRVESWRDVMRSHALYHTTWYRPCPVEGIPSVVVVYDMVTEAMPGQYHGSAEEDWRAKRKAVESAAAIITISETTKHHLLRMFPNLECEVTAIPLGADHFERTQIEAHEVRKQTHPYALFVGDRVGYKNFQCLLEAMLASEWPREVALKVAGKRPTEAELACVRFMGLEGKVEFVGSVPDEELGALYNEAAVFVFPSRFEGFGLPLLEAQARGTPVVATDMEIFREVGGDAFLPCDSKSPSCIATAVASALEPATRDRLIKAGFENVRRFTWDETARKTQDVWQACLIHSGTGI